MKTLRLVLVSSLFALTVMAVPQDAKAAPNTPPIDAAYNSRVIDDAVFSNQGTMSAAAIQSFLNSKVPVCRAGYVCLKDYRDPQDPLNRTAAQLIYDTAQNLQINPQVIITTLQKEQSLITDDYPYASQFRDAMGYGCPESQSTCNTQYNGLYNQISLGSKLLKVGQLRNCGDTTSYPGWSVNTRWRIGNTTTVDGKPTYIGTCATGSLFNYTPHRPDSAWLAINGVYYYGNYNFIGIFNRWFGSTWAGSYRSQWVSQTSPAPVVRGSSQTVTIKYRNTGVSTWYQTNVRLGTSNPLDRSSGFYGGTGWVAPNRIQMQETSVAPNQEATFTFTLTGNPPAGRYNEYFRLVAEGVAWMEDWGVYVPVLMADANEAASLVYAVAPDMLNADRQGTVVLKYRNTGTSSWFRDGVNPVRLGTENPRNHESALYTAGNWVAPHRIGLIEPQVAPGDVGTFIFTVTAPETGRYKVAVNPLYEGVIWMNAPVTVSVETGGTYEASWVTQSPAPQITAGQTATAYFDYRNTGTATWYNDGPNAVRLGTDFAQDRASRAASSWLAPNRPATLTQSSVAPGQIGRFAFTVVGPPTGVYNEFFRPVAEGRTWFGQRGAYLPINTVPHYSANWNAQNVPTALTMGQSQTGWIEFKNTGNLPWVKGGANPFRLGTSRPLDRFSSFVGSDWLAPHRIQLDQDTVNPGQVGRFTFTMTPTQAGLSNEYFRPLVEGVSWLQDWGVYFPLNVSN